MVSEYSENETEGETQKKVWETQEVIIKTRLRETESKEKSMV